MKSDPFKSLVLLCGICASLEAFSDTLQTINVQADTQKANVYRSYSIASDGDIRDHANLGLLGRSNVWQAPITVINYDEKIIQSKEKRNLVDLIASTDVSTMAFGGETNTLHGLYVRGYQLDARKFSVNGLSGMYAYQSSPTAAVASAQLIKGASSALNGMDPEGSVSGAVNIETKKATDEPINRLGLAYFSRSRIQGAIDLARRFAQNHAVGMRLNAKVRSGDTDRHDYSERTQEFALNTDYRGEKLKIALDAMYSKRFSNGSRARFQDIQTAEFALPAAPDGRINLVPAWQSQEVTDKTAMLTFSYDLNEFVQLSGGVGHSQSHYDGNFAALTILTQTGDYCVGTGVKNNQCVANRGARYSDQTAKTTSFNLSARGMLDIADLSNSWSIALDRVQRSRLNYWGSGYTNTVKTNLYAPDFSTANQTIPALSTQASTDASYTATSIALSDTVGFFDDQYRVTFGGRMQWVKQNNHLRSVKANADRFSPMLMMNWLPTSHWVIFGNYMEDLEPGAINEDGVMASPRVSRQLEFGVRRNWGNLVSSMSVFQITRPGYWRGNSKSGTDFVRYQAKGQAYAGSIQGKERNRGIELNLYANWLEGQLRPSLGVMYLQSDLIRYPNYADNLIDGVQVSLPNVMIKAGIEWDLPWLKGMSVNTHVQHYGHAYQRSDKRYTFPSYTLVDLGLSYQTKLNHHMLSVSAAVENLFNQHYWQVQRGQYDRSFAVLGMPRTFWLKAEYAF